MLRSAVLLSIVGACFAMPFNTTGNSDNTTVEIDCSLFRPYAIDANMYEVFNGGVWQNRTCQQALIWDQDLCACVNPPFEDAECPGRRAVPENDRQYEVQNWGIWNLEECAQDQIWNQTGCRCDWDPEGPGAVIEGPDFVFPNHVRSCEVMFNATFDQAIKEHSANYYIGRGEYDSEIVVEAVPGSIGGGAARIDDNKMIIWSLAGNDFSDAFQIKFRFQLDSDLQTSSDTFTLFSNGCGSEEASVVLQYVPVSNAYQVFVRDTNNSVSLDCQALQNFDGFHTVSLEYQDNILVLRIDDDDVCGSTDLSGRLESSTCPLALGGDPLSLNRDLVGYLDEVLVRRNCVIEA